MATPPSLIVFSHLRWDFVYQRPQHLLSRLAKNRHVYFIEEPVHVEGQPPSLLRSEPQPGVTVLRPQTAITTHGFSPEQLPVITRLVHDWIKAEGLTDYSLWFYSPLAIPVAEGLQPQAVIYDCMDELSAFLHAPPALLDAEQRLIDEADVVFTGGPSLYEAKRHRHANAHCFSSSVDAAHFAKAISNKFDPVDQAAIPHPRLGFFGVIDERLDLNLVKAVAEARPNWQIVLVGPIVKIDPATVPRLPNIHYLGQKNYADLPGYLSGWDVCLLPFAHNQSTKFISPTKTLEYMAAEKPIVSTSIRDVAEPYGDIVRIADAPADFIAACDELLALTGEAREAMMGKMRQVLSRTSWDQTASRMERLIEQAAEKRAARGPRAAAGSSAPKATKPAASAPVVVIGAGPTGLSAAYHLGEDSILLEKGETVGGWCRSINVDGFTFDFAGHIMFSNDKYVHELYGKLLGDNVHWQDREAWIYSKGVHTRYPFQGSLYGLPADVIKECLVGAIEARFGSLSKKETSPQEKPAAAASAARTTSNGHASNGNGHAGNGHAANGNGSGHAAAKDPIAALAGTAGKDGACQLGDVKDCCGDGVMESTAPLVKAEEAKGDSAPAAPQNFEEFIYKVWGAGIAKHFAVPYNKKLWAVPLTEMETSWLGGRVPMPDLGEMIDGALKPSPKPMGPNARFGYPLRGGFQSLMDGFLPHLTGELRLNSAVAAVSPKERTVTLRDGSVVEYDYLVSTMPLPLLIRSMGDEAPAEIHDAASRLRYISVRCVNIGVGREKLTEKHWIYYPEQTVFHRIFVQGNASPHCNPPGGFGLTCEITYAPEKPLPCEGEELIQRCIKDCHDVGFFNPEDPIWTANEVDMPYAYVVYDHARPKLVAQIRSWLLEQNIVLAGRYSEWEYYNSDHAFLAGRKAAETVRQLQQARIETTSTSTSPKGLVHAGASLPR